MKENDNELISVIIPIYNVEKYIARCLDSIINQTYKNIEIILIDDGTKDSSGVIADEYAKKDRRIRVIHKQNEGLGLTRNVGIENAKGEYIAFVDSDDYIDIDMYEKMYNQLKENELDAVLCDYKRLTKDGKFLNNCEKFNNKIYEKKEIKSEILPSICGSKKFDILVGSACCVLYKTKILKRYNIRFLNERNYVSEDLIFNFDYFSKCKKIKLLKDDFYVYCENEVSLTKRYNPGKTKKFKNLYNELRKKINDNDSECYFGLNTLYLENMRVAIIQEIKLNSNKKNIRENVKDICEDEILCNILKNYNIKYLTWKQKIFTILVKYKMISILIQIVKLIK